MDSEDVKVSISVVSYNQEKYIRQCLMSLVSQKTNFKYEIVVCDDCSTDGTGKIISELAGKYPEKIKAHFNRKNLGVTRNSRKVSKFCNGKYIACCDGDDFWCDDERLQRDVDFLEKNPDYIAVCGRTKVVDEDGNEIKDGMTGLRVNFWDFDKPEFNIKDFEAWKMPGHGSAITARNYYLTHPEYRKLLTYFSDMVGDRVGLMFLAINGKIKCTDNLVTCYRFRQSENAENFMSVYKYKNLKDKDFLMLKKMEIWCRKKANIYIDLSSTKKDRLAGAVVIFMKHPTFYNAGVIGRIILYSGEPLRYIWYVLKTILIKQYYWKIKKQDKTVNL